MKDYALADLFCGAGGTSTGAMQAVEDAGMKPSLLAVNHWDRAIETHTLNRLTPHAQASRLTPDA